jgi:Arc/MetJ family transcription regulator
MRDDRLMRTTLDIDEDVLQAAKELARVHGKTAGQMVSELARRALEPPAVRRLRNGVPVLPRRPAGRPRPTMKLVNQLRDDL